MVDTARVTGRTSPRRDEILEAVAFAAERLLVATDPREAVTEVLGTLGAAADVSRAYLLENTHDPVDGPGFVQTAEWCAPGIDPQMGNPILQGRTWAEIGFERWVEVLGAGEIVLGDVAAFPESERAGLEPQGIRTLLALPVQVEGAWWGSVGFDECVRPRDWASGEIEGLRIAAALIGAAIARHAQDERIRDAEGRYRSVVEQIPAVSYVDVIDDDPARLGFVSPQIESLLGYPRERFFDDPDFWFQIIHPEDAERIDAAATATGRQHEPFDEEYRMRAADGSWVWVHDTSTPVLDEMGRVRHFQGFLVDVTQRREAERHAREADQRFRTLVEQMPAIVYTETVVPGTTRAERMDYVSPAAGIVLGYPQSDWLEDVEFWARVVHPDDAERLAADIEHVNTTGEPLSADYRVVARDGRTVWLHEEARLVRDADDGPLRWHGLMTDVTERMEAEARLQTAERVHRATVEHLPAVVYREVLGTGAPELYVSPQVVRLIGYTPEEWNAGAPTFWHDHLHPDDLEAIDAANRHADETKEPFAEDYRLRRKDGSFVWVHDEATFVEDGNDGWWQGFLLDITERVNAERQVHEAEETFRSIVERNPAVIYTQEFDDDTGVSRTTYVSPRQPEVFGYTADEVIGDPTLWVRTVHPEDRDRVLAADIQSNAEQPDTFSLEYRMIAKDGRIVWVQDQATLVRVEGRAPFWQGFLLDITERKHAEEKLERALAVERDATRSLRALDDMKNTFLQAVSHDLRTPLAAILGLAITLERGDVHLDEADARDLARRIASNARRLDRLVMNLLDLDRLARGIVHPKLSETDVGAIVRRVVSESELVSDARLTTHIPPHTQAVDAAKLERIVENLLANAVRHTPVGATIWVTLRPDAAGVLLLVEDDGPGVPEELRESVFEPFRQGPDAPQYAPGVGVGLTLVRRFAELHGGRAWVEERDGGGASFRVYLPSAPILPAETSGRTR